MPLSAERIRELQADSPIRIEKYRNTMRAKREKKLLEAYVEMSKKIGRLSTRELFLAGLFLYWADAEVLYKLVKTFWIFKKRFQCSLTFIL